MNNFINPSPSVPAAGTAPAKRWFGTYTASVVSTQDPTGASRVTLNIPQVMGTAVSNWAVPIGFVPTLPTVGQIVWAMFLGGDINRPLYLMPTTSSTNTLVPGLSTISTYSMSINTPMQSVAAGVQTTSAGSGGAQTLYTGLASAASTGLTDTTNVVLNSSSADGTTNNAGGYLGYTLASGPVTKPVT